MNVDRLMSAQSPVQTPTNSLSVRMCLDVTSVYASLSQEEVSIPNSENCADPGFFPMKSPSPQSKENKPTLDFPTSNKKGSGGIVTSSEHRKFYFGDGGGGWLAVSYFIYNTTWRKLWLYIYPAFVIWMWYYMSSPTTLLKLVAFIQPTGTYTLLYSIDTTACDTTLLKDQAIFFWSPVVRL
jgi:hypothetical protein